MAKETAVPKQKADDSAIYFSPEAKCSVKANSQAEAEAKFKEMLGEEKPKK